MGQKRKLIKYVIPVLCLSLFLTGCQKEKPVETQKPEQSDKPVISTQKPDNSNMPEILTPPPENEEYDGVWDYNMELIWENDKQFAVQVGCFSSDAMRFGYPEINIKSKTSDAVPDFETGQVRTWIKGLDGMAYVITVNKESGTKFEDYMFTLSHGDTSTEISLTEDRNYLFEESQFADSDYIILDNIWYHILDVEQSATLPDIVVLERMDGKNVDKLPVFHKPMVRFAEYNYNKQMKFTDLPEGCELLDVTVYEGENPGQIELWFNYSADDVKALEEFLKTHVYCYPLGANGIVCF